MLLSASGSALLNLDVPAPMPLELYSPFIIWYSRIARCAGAANKHLKSTLHCCLIVVKSFIDHLTCTCF